MSSLKLLFAVAVFSVLLLFPAVRITAQATVQSTSPKSPDQAQSSSSLASATPVVDRIRSRHSLSCGVSKEEEDYSRAEDHGNRAAFDIDFCKAVAVANLGLNAPLVLRTYPDEPAALKALQQGEVDLVASASPGVVNTAQGLVFTSPTFYDGQGFLTRAGSKLADLTGKKVCFLTGSIAERGLHSYATGRGISYIWYPFSEAGEMEAAFFTGQCDAITSDLSQLMNIRGIDPRRVHEFTVLPEVIRQDPLAAATTTSDPRFSAIVHWVLEALIQAEELGVTQHNVARVAKSARPETQELLGQAYGTGTILGLDPSWAAHVIAAGGNYGEIFNRDLGSDSPFQLERGENRLWTEGGLMFAIPLTDR